MRTPRPLNRRQVVQAVGVASLALLASCERLPIQSPAAPRVRRLAFLSAAPANPYNEVSLAAFRAGMRDLGYVEGHNLLLETRYPEGDDQLAQAAADLVRVQPEVLLAAAPTVARALQAETTTIPIVSAGSGGDLVALGVAASHARPGGNVTGLSTPPLADKQLQLLQEAVPTLSRLLVLFDATNPTFGRYLAPEPIEAAARVLGLPLQFVGTRSADDLEFGVEAAVREHADGLFVSLGPTISANQVWIAELAIRNRLPSMWPLSDAVERGGLMGYGPNRPAMYRRAATYVDKVLKGAKPADLPVEQPTTFELVINLKTAQQLGLTIPQSVLAQATEVIQ